MYCCKAQARHITRYCTTESQKLFLLVLY